MAKVNYKGVVKDGFTLWVRNGPSDTSTAVMTVAPGTVLSITEIENQYVKHDYGGWSQLKNESTVFIDIYSPNEKIPDKKQEDVSKYSDYKQDDTELTDEYILSNNFLNSARGIHGMPYQFMPSVDRRVTSSPFGRMYTEKIVNRMPLLLLTPGRPKFMKSFSVKEKEDVIKYLSQKSSGPVEDLLSREGRFYDIEFNYKDYYQYVNPMCQVTARLLGLQDVVMDGGPLDKYRWENYTNSAFKNFVSSAETIAFYIDSETQISESFSNNTGESLLANKTNSLSDMGRELQFLMGEGAGVQFDMLSQENYDATLQEFDNFSKKWLKMAPQNLIEKLSSGFLSVATGGKMIFPEIWNDSHYSKTYNVNIKLTSPDNDVFSWYMNIAVPLLHLMALVAPQQMGPNAYKSPFIIKGFYKGFWNCGMGIITGMNVNKGEASKWTLNGLPTQVDVSLDIKDLYQILTITKESEIVHLMNNIGLLDYLANMCGININKPDILRSLDIYVNQFVNNIGIQGKFNRGFLTLEQALSTKLNDIFDVFK